MRSSVAIDSHDMISKLAFISINQIRFKKWMFLLYPLSKTCLQQKSKWGVRMDTAQGNEFVSFFIKEMLYKYWLGVSINFSCVRTLSGLLLTNLLKIDTWWQLSSCYVWKSVQVSCIGCILREERNSNGQHWINYIFTLLGKIGKIFVVAHGRKNISLFTSVLV